MSGQTFSSNERVPICGIYRVSHGPHRLPHEALLLAGEQFPRCAKCSDAVVFELLAATPALDQKTAKVARIYELPVVEDDSESVAS